MPQNYSVATSNGIRNVVPAHQGVTMNTPNTGASKGSEKYTLNFTVEGEPGVLSQIGDADDTLATIVAALAAAHQRSDLRNFLVSPEDADEPAVSSTLVRDLVAANRRVRAHLHKCRRIKVTVEYNTRTIADEFPPAATVHRVLKWAVGPKGFDLQDDVHDLVLQVKGTTKPLEPHIHIGTLVRRGTCALALELVPKDRPQG